MKVTHGWRVDIDPATSEKMRRWVVPYENVFIDAGHKLNKSNCHSSQESVKIGTQQVGINKLKFHSQNGLQSLQSYEMNIWYHIIDVGFI